MPREPQSPERMTARQTEYLIAITPILQGLLASGHYTKAQDFEEPPELISSASGESFAIIDAMHLFRQLREVIERKIE